MSDETMREWITGDDLYEIMTTFGERADVSEIADRINAAINNRLSTRDEVGPVTGEGGEVASGECELAASLSRMQFLLANVEEGVPAICDSPLFASYEFAADFKRIVDFATAHSSPHPAADADRVRIAVELINAEINAPLTGPTHGAWDRGRIAGLKEALAALKSSEVEK